VDESRKTGDNVEEIKKPVRTLYLTMSFRYRLKTRQDDEFTSQDLFLATQKRKTLERRMKYL